MTKISTQISHFDLRHYNYISENMYIIITEINNFYNLVIVNIFNVKIFFLLRTII